MSSYYIPCTLHIVAEGASEEALLEELEHLSLLARASIEGKVTSKKISAWLKSSSDHSNIVSVFCAFFFFSWGSKSRLCVGERKGLCVHEHGTWSDGCQECQDIINSSIPNCNKKKESFADEFQMLIKWIVTTNGTGANRNRRPMVYILEYMANEVLGLVVLLSWIATTCVHTFTAGSISHPHTRKGCLLGFVPCSFSPLCLPFGFLF